MSEEFSSMIEGVECKSKESTVLPLINVICGFLSRTDSTREDGKVTLLGMDYDYSCYNIGNTVRIDLKNEKEHIYSE